MYDVIFNSGFIGFLIWVLLFAVSTTALAITIRCIWLLRKKRFMSVSFQKQLIPLLQQGNWQDAFNYCEAHSSLTEKVMKKILRVAHEKDAIMRQEIASEMIDRQVKAILRQFNSLSMCGNIAPMLGLLGTVTGMVDAFMGLGTAMGPEKASILAISISQALYTTAAGLLIAIPAIACTVYLRNTLEKRIEAVVDQLEQAMKHIPEPAQANYTQAETAN